MKKEYKWFSDLIKEVERQGFCNVEQNNTLVGITIMKKQSERYDYVFDTFEYDYKKDVAYGYIGNNSIVIFKSHRNKSHD